METQVKKIREQFTVVELENNYNEAIKTINEIVNKNQFRISREIIDGEKIDIDNLKPDFSGLSRNARKNIAKRFHFLDKKKSNKTANVLLFILNKKGVIKGKVSVKLGAKEKEIQRLRSIWKIMERKAEEARLAYKTEKGDFYKTKVY